MMRKRRWLPFVLALGPAIAVANEVPPFPVSAAYGDSVGCAVAAGFESEGGTYSYVTPTEVRAGEWSCEPTRFGRADSPKVGLICAVAGGTPTYQEGLFKENKETGSLDIIVSERTYRMRRCDIGTRIPSPRPNSPARSSMVQTAPVEGGLHSFLLGSQPPDAVAELLARVESTPE